VIQSSREGTSETSIKAKSLDLEVRIQELTCGCRNNGPLESPQALPQMSFRVVMFIGVPFQPFHSL